MCPRVLRATDCCDGVEPSDVEASVYDLGTTSVKLVRVGNIVQIVFSNRHDARVVHAELASKFMKDQEKFGRGLG